MFGPLYLCIYISALKFPFVGGQISDSTLIFPPQQATQGTSFFTSSVKSLAFVSLDHGKTSRRPMAAEQGSWLLEPFTDPMFVYFPLGTGAAALASLLVFMLPLTLLSFKDPAYLSKYKVLKPMLVWFTSIFHSFFLFLCFLTTLIWKGECTLTFSNHPVHLKLGLSLVILSQTVDAVTSQFHLASVHTNTQTKNRRRCISN